MKITKRTKIALGGGVVTDFTPSSRHSVAKSSGFFKPIVATSLALALGVSAMSADNLTISSDTTKSEATLEAIKFNSGVTATLTLSNANGVTIQATNGNGFNNAGGSGNYSLVIGPAYDAKTNATLIFQGTTSTIGNTLVRLGSTGNFVVSKDNATLTFTQFNNQGTTNITFGSTSGTADKSGTLIFTNGISSNYSNNGTIIKMGGSGNNLIQGSISTQGAGSGDGGKITIEMSGSAENKFQGNVTAKGSYNDNGQEGGYIYSKGVNRITFSNGKGLLIGDIYSQGSTTNSGESRGENTITFSGSSGEIQGNITATAGSTGGRGINNLNFNATSNLITGEVTSIVGGTNNITYSKDNSTSEIVGVLKNDDRGVLNLNLSAEGGSLTILKSDKSTRGEILTMGNGNSITTINATTATTAFTLNSDIYSRWGQTKVYLGGSGSSNTTSKFAINGDLRTTNIGSILIQANATTSNLTMGDSTHSYNINNEGTINISKNSKALSLTGYFGTISSLGTLTFDLASANITANQITASKSGTNSITAESGSLTIKQGISTKEYSNSGSGNTLNLGTGSITITAGSIEGGSYAVYAKNGNNSNSITASTLKITGDIFAGSEANNTLTATTLTINSGSSVLANSGSNIINAGSSTTSISLTKVSASGSGSNTITAENGNLTIKQGVSTSGYNDNKNGNGIIAENSSITITAGDIEGGSYAVYAKNGNNSNVIGSNTLKITGDIFAGSEASNILIAKAQGGSTITGNIITNSGSNTIAINGDSNNTTSSSLSGNITNNGTTNIILQDSTWAPNSLKKSISATPTSGTLTNNSGSTNLVIRTTGTINQNGDIPIYNVNANGGNTNIVMQGEASAVAHLNYGGGKANLIFASSNDNASDSFSDINVASNKVLGKTYTDGVKLALFDINVAIQDSQKSLISTFGDNFRDTDGTLLKLDVARTANKDTITIDGLVAGNITSLADNAGQSSKSYEVTLAQKSAFVGSLGIESEKITLTMQDNSKLVLAGDKTTAHTKIATLNLSNVSFDSNQTMNPIFDQTNTVINLATGVNDVYNAPTRSDFRLLEIGSKGGTATTNTGLVGKNALFQVYVNTDAGSNATLGGKSKSEWTDSSNYGSQYSADRIIVHNVGNNSTTTTQHLQIVYDANTKIESIKYDPYGAGTSGANNVAVATVANTGSATGTGVSDKGAVNFQLQSTLQGFDEIVSTLKGIYTNEYGVADSTATNNTYTTYFIDNAKSAGASEANREATASALGVNYDLYMANFNSLNKRMGELRENDNSQGAWVRIFNGAQTNTMGLGTKSTYTTFQGGYDYAFGFEGANNYLGVALSYGMSDSKTQSSMSDLNGEQRGVEDIKSNAIEVAIYNSYVQDEGWYNDTIAKFSYIFSDFSMMGQNSTYSTSNMAFTLSDEFGYRFKLGSEKEWYIDPQLEVALGYFDQSDFVQTLGVASLQGSLDSIITTRARFGSSFGYDFKRFTKGKGINASIYLGAFYEYDYISGGDVTMVTNLGSTNSINSLSSDGRVVMNVGTNMTIKDNTRIYFDFEKSFAGKITTDYQVNVGVRYSFGENTGYTPMTEKKSITPLKVSENPSTKTENKEGESEKTAQEQVETPQESKAQ